jgi:hypothetical protein
LARDPNGDEASARVAEARETASRLSTRQLGPHHTAELTTESTYSENEQYDLSAFPLVKEPRSRRGSRDILLTGQDIPVTQLGPPE